MHDAAANAVSSSSSSEQFICTLTDNGLQSANYATEEEEKEESKHIETRVYE